MLKLAMRPFPAHHSQETGVLQVRDLLANLPGHGQNILSHLPPVAGLLLSWMPDELHELLGFH